MARGKVTSNIGKTGVESIRLSGMKIDDLPIGEAARAAMQLPIAEEDVRQRMIANIRKRYPTQDVAYLQARIQEARSNISRFRDQLVRIGGQREEYRFLLINVKEREKQIQEARETLYGEDLAEEIKALTRQYGPWQLEGLKKQIEQFTESIKRFEATIEQEQRSIDEMSELLGQCKARDKELMQLGA